MTFSIIAIDKENGECGFAVASCTPNVGKKVGSAEPNIGVFCTQCVSKPQWREKVIKSLQDNIPVSSIMNDLIQNDDAPEDRQLAIIDMNGNNINHDPSQSEARHYSGSYTGTNFSCQGNRLVNKNVIDKMVNVMENESGSLVDKMMKALLAGDKEGGDKKGRLSAGIKVVSNNSPQPIFEDYVFLNGCAVQTLYNKYIENQS